MAQRQQHFKQHRSAPYKMPPKQSGGAQKNPDGSVTIPDHVDIGQVSSILERVNTNIIDTSRLSTLLPFKQAINC